MFMVSDADAEKLPEVSRSPSMEYVLCPYKKASWRGSIVQRGEALSSPTGTCDFGSLADARRARAREFSEDLT
jgi:hypothetical protein